MSATELIGSAVHVARTRDRWHTLQSVGVRARRIGLASLALLLWTAGAGYGGIAILWGIGLTFCSLVAYEVALGDRGDYIDATSVQVVRHLQAWVVGTSAALLTALLIGGLQPIRLVAAGLALLFYGAIWDLAVCRAHRLRRPLRLMCVGSGAAAGRLTQAFALSRPRGLELVGSIATGGGAMSLPLLGSLDELEQLVAEHRIDAIVLADDATRLEVLEHLLDGLNDPPSVLELSEVYERAFGRVPVEEIDAAWFVRALALSRRTAPTGPRRLLEVAVTTALIVLTAPWMVLFALMVRLDSPGPSFYRQRRVGERGRTFTMMKFRSMVVDSEADGPRWADQDDPRITRVGRLLRRFRLDELPQLFNVLRGDMALVGPRPERPELVGELIRELPFYQPRHLVRPGITGWAQVYAPYAASVDDTLQKLSYDLYYLKHSSVATDLGIMLRTAGVMVGGRGAR